MDSIELEALASQNKLHGFYTLDQIPDNDEYHQGPGVSRTDLCRLGKSIEYYEYCAKNPDNSDTEAKLFGRAFHSAFLTPHLFEKEFIKQEKFERRTKIGKADYAAFVEKHSDKTIVPADSYDRILEMVEKLRSDKLVGSLFAEGNPEVSMYWRDRRTGILCKARCDWLKKNNIIVDLKKTRQTSQKKFSRDIANYNYDIQNAFYLEGLREITKKREADFVFVEIEDEPPYEINHYDITTAAIDNAREAVHGLLDKYKRYLEGEFDNQEKQIITVNPPMYAFDLASRFDF